MRIGDRAELLMLPEYGYGAQGSPPKIPGNSVLLFDVELLAVDYSTAELTLAEKIEQCTLAKDQGNTFFKQGQWPEAAEQYTAGTKYLSSTWGAEEEQDTVKQLNISLYSNLAAVQLKLGNPQKAAEAAQKVLEWDDKHPKALYRLSQAKLAMQEFDEALEILQTNGETLGINVDMEIKKVQVCKKQFQQAEKQMYSKMFA
jgi:peptidylprolyl isomerase